MNDPKQPNEMVPALRVAGDLLSTNAEKVRRDFFALIHSLERNAPAWTCFQLDLSAAQMIDSVGLNLVVTILKEINSRRAALRILYANPNLQRIFQFTRLDNRLELVKKPLDGV